MLDNYIKWFKAHEAILASVLILGTVLFLGNKYLDRASSEADARNQAAQQTLAAQKEANDKLAIQNQQAAAQYQVVLGQINAQNQRLTAEMLSLSQSLVARQKQDAGLTTTELAARHESLIGISGVNYTENGYLLSSPAELQTVQQLESLPVARQQLVDETTLANNKDKQITSINTVVTGLNEQINGLNLQVVDADKACTTKIDAVKKDARKSKRNWFVGGLLTGAGIVAKLLL